MYQSFNVAGLSMRRYSGFTLIELMIALILGLLLLSGLYSMLSANQHSVALVRSNGQLITDGQRALSVMRMYIQQAGYRDFNRVENEIFLPASGAWVTKQFVSGTDNAITSGAVKTGTDELLVRFFGSGTSSADNTIYDCAGAGISAATSISVRWYVSPANELRCNDSVGNNIVVTDSVENLQVRYLLTSSSNPRYLNAPLTSTQWLDVSRVEFGLLLSTPFDQSVSSSQNSYQLLGVSNSLPNDKQLRQTFSESVLIRNTGS